jgi:hypothetical protein
MRMRNYLENAVEVPYRDLPTLRTLESPDTLDVTLIEFPGCLGL